MSLKKNVGNIALIIMILLFVLQIIISSDNLLNTADSVTIPQILWYGSPILILIIVIVFIAKDKNKLNINVFH